MILRDYQHDGVNAIRQAYRNGARRALYVLPTGAGKTVTFAYMARAAAVKGTRTCLMVHRSELVEQIRAALGCEHGVIAAGYRSPRADRDQQIHVASVQTLVRRRHKYQFDWIIVDEAHHCNADTYLKILQANPKARVLGVTATPVRSDGKGLGDVFDDLVVGPSPAELIDLGYLSPYRAFAPSSIDTTGVRKRAGDFARGDLSKAADKPTITGDAITHYRRLCDGVPAIAFCVSVKHAQHTAAAFEAAGYRAASIDGKMERPEIKRRIDGLTTGAVQVLTSCDLISEGLDVPGVQAAILLRPTQSLGLCRQQVGRALRTAPGKDEAIILDHAGNLLRHGMPDDEIVWELTATKAVQDDDQAEKGVKVRQCPKCYAVHRWAPRCIECGHEYVPEPREIQEQEGELQELQAQRRQLRIEVAQAKTREDLERIAAERGYKPGWVHYMLRARQQRRAG